MKADNNSFDHTPPNAVVALGGADHELILVPKSVFTMVFWPHLLKLQRQGAACSWR